MPKFLADGTTKLALLDARPADINSITVTEATAGVDVSCLILDPLQIGPSGSDTVDEKALCDQGNAQSWGASNFTGRSITGFRYYDESEHQPDPAEDLAWEAMNTKGSVLYCLYRKGGKASTEDFAEGDEVRYVEYTVDDPQEPDDTDGYTKFISQLAYAGQAALDNTLVAS